MILDDYMPEKFVIGLPKSLSGEEEAQANHVKDIAEEISLLYGLPFEYAHGVEIRSACRRFGHS